MSRLRMLVIGLQVVRKKSKMDCGQLTHLNNKSTRCILSISEYLSSNVYSKFLLNVSLSFFHTWALSNSKKAKQAAVKGSWLFDSCFLRKLVTISEKVFSVSIIYTRKRKKREKKNGEKTKISLLGNPTMHCSSRTVNTVSGVNYYISIKYEYK